MESGLQAVRDFVVNVLGCGCPEEVLRDIRLNRAPGAVAGVPLLFEIRVGGRLLIFGVSAEHLKGCAAPLAGLAEAGRKTRDDSGFNRFRLVAVGADAAAGELLHREWGELSGLDERMHLHVVQKSEAGGFVGD